MTDNQQAVSEASEATVSEVNTPAAAPTVEQTPGEVTEPTGEETETGGKGAAQRIKELNQRAKAAETKVSSLEEKIAELTRTDEPAGYTKPAFNPQEPIVQPGEEIDVNELNRRITDREQRLLEQAEARIELKSRQQDAITRHRNETAEVLQAYPQLNPKSNEFDPELSETVTEAIESHLKANPYTASVKKFADKLMKPYQRAVAKEVGQATENIAKQVSEAAIRPTSVRKGEKTAADMSIAELEAKLGIKYS
jgi:hypothetical protein